jgi:hypothetical protein
MLFKSVSVGIVLFLLRTVIRGGNNLFDPADIAMEFVNYFKTIFRSSANNDRINLETAVPQDTNDFTNSIPDKQEIWEILKAMRKNASPGPDGFNVGFYLSAWSWIGDDCRIT